MQDRASRRCANIPHQTTHPEDGVFCYSLDQTAIRIRLLIFLLCASAAQGHPTCNMASRTAVLLLALVGLAAVVSTADAGGLAPLLAPALNSLHNTSLDGKQLPLFEGFGWLHSRDYCNWPPE
jgi:hypothetical protein